MGQHRKTAAEQLLRSQTPGLLGAAAGDQRTPETTLVRLQDLVVITPSMDGSGLDAAGDLPLAEDPRFPDARSTFLGNMRAHGQASAQKAMLQAMAAGS